MHTFTSRHVTFAFNGDGSGDVTIRSNEAAAEAPCKTVPVDTVVAFVAELVRRRRIAELEEMSPHELLGLERKQHKLAVQL